jgi:hypothetical protein
MQTLMLLFLLLQHDHKHHDAVDRRGDKVMGFSHQKTIHRFEDTKTGGIIEATTKAKEDAEQRGAIQRHFQQIAKAFPQGDFSMPVAIHDRLLDGAAEMKSAGAAIQYRYEALPHGARLHLVTKDASALAAIHRFLAFQRSDHRAH